MGRGPGHCVTAEGAIEGAVAAVHQLKGAVLDARLWDTCAD